MDENISCNVVRDLLPLYVDGAASTGTRKLIALHLEFCEDCQKQCEAMKKKTGRDGMRNSGDAARRKLKRALRLRRAGRGTLIALAVLFVAWFLSTRPTWPIDYMPILRYSGTEEREGGYYIRTVTPNTVNAVEALPAGCLLLGPLNELEITNRGGYNYWVSGQLQAERVDERYLGQEVWLDPAANRLYLEDPAGFYIAFDYERELEHWYWDPDSTTESEYSFAMIQYNSGLYTYENSTSAYRNDCLETGEILGVLPDEGFPPGGECFASGLDESYVGNRFYITPNGYDLYLEREGGGYLSFSFRSHLFPDRAVE